MKGRAKRKAIFREWNRIGTHTIVNLFWQVQMAEYMARIVKPDLGTFSKVG